MASSSPESSTFPNPIPQWSEQAVFLKDLAAKYPVPNLVKIIKGQYRNIGVAKSVHTELYLHSIKTTKKVLAEAVRVKDSGKNRIVVSDQKYSLPVTYQGWFELLSEDGKSVRAMQNVQELANYSPQSCLVRENMKAFVQQGDADMSSDKVKVIVAGERLTLVGEVNLPFNMGKAGVTNRRLLRCIDSKGENVFMAYEQRGLFSPIAGQTNISGVHMLKGLLEKFRLPIMVRLVHGIIPTKMEKGFTGAFRLASVYSDETAFLCPHKAEAKMVPISTREPLKLVVAANYDVMKTTEEVKHFQQRCAEMLSSYMNSIHILIAMPDPVALAKGREEQMKSQMQQVRRSSSKTSPGSVSDSNAAVFSNTLDSKSVLSLNSPGGTRAPLPPGEEDVLFEEIDDIYHYVREGGLPPAPRARKIPIATEPSTAFRESIQNLINDNDPTMETKMQQMDLTEEDMPDLGTVTRDNNYWEEPIYEPLEKIREKKKLSGRKQSVDGYSPQHEGYRNGALTSNSSSGEEMSPSSSKVDLERVPIVANLRQILKADGQVGPRTPERGDAPAPPVPPKQYDDKGLQLAERIRQGRAVSGRNGAKTGPRLRMEGNNGPRGGPFAQSSRNTGFDEVTPAIVAALEASPTSPTMRHSRSANAVGNSPSPHNYSQSPRFPSSNGKSRVISSPSSPESPLGSAHPPYMAVAQVGDYNRDVRQASRATAVVSVNPDKYATTRQSNGESAYEIAKRRLQTVYL